MFDYRSTQLLEELLSYPEKNVPELRRKLKLSNRQFHYDLKKMNDGLMELGLSIVQLDGMNLNVPDSLLKSIPFDVISDKQLVYSEEQRMYLIYLYTFIRQEPVSNLHYLLVLNVSKNTALSDIKKVRKLCEEEEVDLLYSRSEGYHLWGLEENKRRLAAISINRILPFPFAEKALQNLFSEWKVSFNYELIRELFERTAKENKIHYVTDRLDELAYFLAFIQIRQQRQTILYTEEQSAVITKHPLYTVGDSLANELFHHPSIEEAMFVTIQLLAAVQGSMKDMFYPFLEKMASELIESVERQTFVEIPNRAELQRTLYQHLVPAYYRIQFRVPISNPLIEKIQSQQAELYAIVKEALQPLAARTKQPISAEEVGFFTIHFGSQFKLAKPNEYKAILVCLNGVSSSLMMRTQLSQLFPKLTFTQNYSIEEFMSVDPASYDVVFSTVPLACSNPVHVIPPLLTAVEKNQLIQAVGRHIPDLVVWNVSMEEIMATIHRYADVKNEKALYEALFSKLWSNTSPERNYQPMLSELLTENMMQFTNESLNWEEAIKLSASPLANNGRVESSYIEAMVKKVKENGTYIYIGKGIAIPHARPEDGVNQVGMSLLRVSRPVYLLDDENYPVELFICLAAIDSQTHLKALSQLTTLLSNNEAIETLKEMQSPEELHAFIKNKEVVL
ncbi:BglG family transcription antiterminator [Metabacillus herbersteinensis]|uniref:Ascorbate-specific PTS system EIIA component n=1 Tax=Metabacillus herbersteinensis TaxID=283816 RepID=A0ABV6GBB7_9BACI